jgi:hypothetical protein
MDDINIPGPADSGVVLDHPTVGETVREFMSSNPRVKQLAVLSVFVPTKLFRSNTLWQEVYKALPTAELKRDWIDSLEKLGL